MASTSFKPSNFEQATRRWTVHGYSWLKGKKTGESVDSPPIITLGDTQFGIRLYPDGYNEDSCGWVSIFIWYKGKTEFQVDFGLTLFSPTGQLKKGNSAQVVRCKSNQWFLETNGVVTEHASLGISKFAGKGLKGYLQDDTAIVELSISAWSPTSVDCIHEGDKTDCPNTLKCGKLQLSSDLGQLLREQKHTDVVLQASDPEGAGSETLHAHRTILAARSPVFEKMLFGEGMRESSPDAVVSMCDVRPDVARSFLHSLYTDEIQNEAWENEEMLCHLFATFHKYQVQELLKRCQGRVITQLSEENVAERFMMSDLLDIPAMRSAALEFIISTPARLANVQATDGFQRLIEQRPKMLAEILAKSVPPPKRASVDLTQHGDLPSNLGEMRVVQLKGLLSDRGLPTTGSKADLVSRLRASR